MTATRSRLATVLMVVGITQLASGCWGDSRPLARDSAVGGASAAGGAGAAGGTTGTGGASSTGGIPGTGGADGMDGGTSTDGSCSSFDGCGGSVVGTWSLVSDSECGALWSSCAGITTTGQFQTTASYTFTGSNTYNITSTYSGTVQTTYPQACYSVYECSQIIPPTDLLLQTCVSNASGDCVCETSWTRPVIQEGTYTTSEATIALVSTTGGTSRPLTERIAYCVNGNSLTLHITLGEPNYSRTIVLKKQ